MTQYILVSESELVEPMELPAEPDGTLLFTTLNAQFPSSIGLKYRSRTSGLMRGVRAMVDRLLPPSGGWGVRLFLVVYRQDTPQDVAEDHDGGSTADQLLKKITDNFLADPSGHIFVFRNMENVSFGQGKATNKDNGLSNELNTSKDVNDLTLNNVNFLTDSIPKVGFIASVSNSVLKNKLKRALSYGEIAQEKKKKTNCKDSIFREMNKEAGPVSKVLATMKDALKFFSKDSFGVIGFFTSEDSSEAKTFFKFAVHFSEVRFAHTFNEEVKKELKKKDGVVLYRPKVLQSKFKEAEVRFTETIQDKLKTAIETECVECFEQMVEEILDNNVELYMKSEPEPASTDSTVKVVVAKTFDSIVNDENKDVLILLYAPLCRLCMSLGLKYDELAEKLKNERDLVIAKMDATTNDVPYPYDVREFPAIYFSPKGSNSSPKLYEDGHEVYDFMIYLAKQSTDGLNGYKRDGKKKKAKKEKNKL